MKGDAASTSQDNPDPREAVAALRGGQETPVSLSLPKRIPAISCPERGLPSALLCWLVFITSLLLPEPLPISLCQVQSMLPIMMEWKRVSVGAYLAELLIKRPQGFWFILLIM